MNNKCHLLCTKQSIINNDGKKNFIVVDYDEKRFIFSCSTYFCPFLMYYVSSCILLCCFPQLFDVQVPFPTLN